MPDWTGSFHKPMMTTDAFLAARSKYVAKHGYRYSIPGFDDIFKLNIEKPITSEEAKIWKNKQFSELSPERYEELKYMKNQRKEAYLDMLGSPQPQILRSRGALIGAIDDAQDAMATLSTAGLVALRMSSAAAQKAWLGPLGLLLTATEALEIANGVLTPERALVKLKPAMEKHFERHPKETTAKVKLANRVKNARIHKGTVLEALQVTDNMFGYGISLGALMNIPMDIIFATARAYPNYPVFPRLPIPNIPHWKRRGMKAIKAIGVLMSSGTNVATQNYTQLLIAANASAQLHNSGEAGWHPFIDIPDLANLQIKAPEPSNILSIEAINEIDPRGMDAIRWPTTGETWSTPNELMDTMPGEINNFLNKYIHDEQYSPEGLVGSVNATEATLHMLEAVEGKGSVVIDHTADTKAITGLLNAGYTFPRDITPAQIERWKMFTASYEAQGISPALKDSLNYARNIAGFSFVQQVDYFR